MHPVSTELSFVNFEELWSRRFCTWSNGLVFYPTVLKCLCTIGTCLAVKSTQNFSTKMMLPWHCCYKALSTSNLLMYFDWQMGSLTSFIWTFGLSAIILKKCVHSHQPLVVIYKHDILGISKSYNLHQIWKLICDKTGRYYGIYESHIYQITWKETRHLCKIVADKISRRPQIVIYTHSLHVQCSCTFSFQHCIMKREWVLQS